MKKARKMTALLLALALGSGTLFGAGTPAAQAAGDENESVELLAGGSAWRYLDNGVDQGTAWRAADFNATSWASGSAPLGFKTSGSTATANVSTTTFGSVKTIVSYGASTSAKNRTTYFRTTVDVEDLENYDSITGTFGVDDGVVLYANGTEIFRGSMPSGDISYSTLATTNLSDPQTLTADLTTALKTAASQSDQIVLAAEVHQTSDSSSDLYWDMKLFGHHIDMEEAGKPVSIVMNYNGDPKTRMGFAWYTKAIVSGTNLEVVEASKVIDGKFPAEGVRSFTGTTAAAGSTGSNTHKVVATDLQPGTTYAYRAGDQEKSLWSSVGTFTTEAAADEDGYTFLYVTDSQGTDQDEFAEWNHTLVRGLATFPQSKFIVHTGDLVEHGANEQEWGWFFSEPQATLMNYPLMPLVGNHESKSNANFGYHFNLPNVSNTGAAPEGSVYSFDYGQAHVMVLNSEYYNNEIYQKQVEWLKSEVAKTDKKWKIVMMHKSLYSVANHSDDTDVLYYRNNLAPVFDELGIDLVLSGHDHTYARSYPMLNNEPIKDVTIDAEGNAVNPAGTQYLIINAAGHKFYNVEAGPFPYAAKYGQPGKQMFSGVTVKDDTLGFDVYTTTTGGTTELYDKYSIKRDDVRVSPVTGAKAVRNEKGSVTLTWTAPAGQSQSAYRIYEANDRAGSNWNATVKHVEGTSTYSYVVEGATADLPYEFVIKAVNGRDQSAPVSVKVSEPAAVGAVLNGAGAVKAGQSLELTYGLTGVEAGINAQDITVDYEADKLVFAGAESLRNDVVVVETQDSAAGKVRIIAANPGQAAILNGDLLKLKWTVKDVAAGETAVSVTNLVVADGFGTETVLAGAKHELSISNVDTAALQALIQDSQAKHDSAVEGTQAGQYQSGAKAKLAQAINSATAVANDASATEQQVAAALSSLNEALVVFENAKNKTSQGDVNEDQHVTIGDLGIVAAAYGKTSADTDWQQVKRADVNNDGIIDLLDLVILSKAILGTVK